MPPDSSAERIADLETELGQRDDKIKELRADLAEAQELVDRMREQVEDSDRLIDQWIDTFDMQRDEQDNNWVFDSNQSHLWEQHAALWERHQKVVRQWNKTVAKFNAVVARRPIGRPLAASAEQQAKVLKQHKAGTSLRGIVTATGLSLRTVRTILDRAAGKGRTAAKQSAYRREEFAKARAAAYRARKAARDRLPAQIAETQKTAAELVGAAKGLGRCVSTI